MKATTFLHVFVGRPDAGNPTVLSGHIEIKSLVMIPGSISARDTSMNRLAAKLLAAVRAQQAERAGVIQAPTDIAR